MAHSIMKNVGSRGITDMQPIPLPPKGIMTIQRARGDGMGSLYTKREAFYFENGKFYKLKVDFPGNMNYNKQFPVRKPVLGKWDEYGIREVA